MWAVAAAVSSQFRQLAGMLATESCGILRGLDVTSEVQSVSLEQIQALLLIAYYEILCKNENKATVTVGQAMRMVQLGRLHDIDTDENTSSELQFLAPDSTPEPSRSLLPDNEGFAEIEEKRRTFWLAYCLDRFCLMRNGWHSSLQEDLVSAPSKKKGVTQTNTADRPFFLLGNNS